MKIKDTRHMLYTGVGRSDCVAGVPDRVMGNAGKRVVRPVERRRWL